MIAAEHTSADPAETPANGFAWLARVDARWPGLRRRVGGLALALGIELALFLALLTLGPGAGKREAPAALTTIDFAPEQVAPDQPPQPEQEAPPTALPRAVPAPQPEVVPVEVQPRPTSEPIPLPPPATIIPVSPRQEAAPAPSTAKARAVVRDDMQGPIGPPNRPSSGDSQRVGSRPGGEPVYGARWYREPTDSELRGYLSTASGPGWALITCKTAPGYRVEDCELEDEYPSGSQIGRAVLAAAWQFKVRPPQVGGRVLVGEWVRIRISYEQRRG